MKRGSVRRPIRSVASLITLALVSGSFACQPVTFIRDLAGEPRVDPRILEDEVVTLVTTKFRSVDAPVFYSARDRCSFEFHFDPALVDLSRVEAVSLYRQERAGQSYRRIARFSTHAAAAVDARPLIYEFQSDGFYGLRASVTYGNGLEVLVPDATDPPLICLYIDRHGPSVQWLSPGPGEILGADEKVALRWELTDREFGDEPAEVSWSGDGGDTWLVIDHVPAVSGESSIRWRTPENPPFTALLRIRVCDIVGNETRASTSLRFGPGSEKVSPDGVPDIVRPASESAPSEEFVGPPAPPEPVSGSGQPVPASAKGKARVSPASFRPVPPVGESAAAEDAAAGTNSGEGKPRS